MRPLLHLLALAAPLTAQDLDTVLAGATEAWDRQDSPGGVVGVLRGGVLQHVHAFGQADLAAGVPNSAKTPFYLASLAKPFTAACVVHADRAGLLDLDDPVRGWFEELPASHAPVRLRHLLHHGSGIADLYDATIALDLDPAGLSSNAAALERVARLPGLAFAPGSRLLYNNTGYVLLAEAVALAAEVDLATYASDNIFGPLGMETARFGGRAGARSYAHGADGWVERQDGSGLIGPGGMSASLADLAAFERAWWGKGATERDALLAVPAGAHHPRIGSYASGWMVSSFRGLPVERHFGGAFGYSADLLRFPSHGLTVIALVNADDLEATDLTEAVAAHLLADEFPDARPQPVELTAEQRARFGRFWRSTETGILWALVPTRAGLAVATLGDVKLDLVPVAPDRLVAPDAPRPFALVLDGDALEVRAGDAAPDRLERLPFPPTGLAPAEEHAGTYRHAALEAQVHFAAGPRGTLTLSQRDDTLLALPAFHQLARDTYVCDRGAQLDFERDAEGKVVRLHFHANRAWGLVLERVE